MPEIPEDAPADLRSALQAAKASGLTRPQALALVDEVLPPRLAAGLEVVEGWEMPEPPRPGLIPHFQLHGCDGLEYWWQDAVTGERLDLWADPFADEPDTGGQNYKQTEAALRELGFHG